MSLGGSYSRPKSYRHRPERAAQFTRPHRILRRLKSQICTRISLIAYRSIFPRVLRQQHQQSRGLSSQLARTMNHQKLHPSRRILDGYLIKMADSRKGPRQNTLRAHLISLTRSTKEGLGDPLTLQLYNQGQ